MADELPPLSRLPAQPLSPELVGQLEHSANWARTFGGSDTNIAQRFRHNQDIEQYGAVLQQQREQAQMETLQRDRAAQSLYFGMEKLNLQEKEAKARMAHAAELHPLKVQAQEAKIKADLRKDSAAVVMDDLKADIDEQTQADTETFLKTLKDGRTRGMRPGTDEWEALVIDARLAAPGMPTKLYDDIYKSTSRSRMDPQEAIDQAVARKKALMAVDPKDTISPALERDRSLYARELSKAESRRAAAKDDDTKALFDQDIREYREKLTEAESQLRAHREGSAPTSPSSAPASPGLTATNPKTGQKLVFKDGQWQPLP